MVGPDKQEFHVQLSHIERTSPVFRATFQEHWAEGQESKVNLKDDEPNTVHIYLYYAYTGKIAFKKTHENISYGQILCSEEYPLLAKLYCLGEFYQDIAFKNAVIDAIIANSETPGPNGHRWYPTGESVEIIYNGTCEGSLARKLLVDMHRVDGNEAWWDPQSTNSEFMHGLSTAFYQAEAKRKSKASFEIFEFEDEKEPEGVVIRNGFGSYNNAAYHERASLDIDSDFSELHPDSPGPGLDVDSSGLHRDLPEISSDSETSSSG